MADDHEMRVECAKEFAKLGSELARAANGRVQQAQQVSELTQAISKYHTENLKITGEIKDFLHKNLLVTENRLTSLESLAGSNKEATLTLQARFWAIIILIGGGVISAVGAALAGVFK